MGAFTGSYSRPLSQRNLQIEVGGDLSSLKKAIEVAGVTPTRVGTHLRFDTADVPKIKAAMNKDLVPVFVEVPVEDAAWLAGFFDGEGHAGVHSSVDSRARLGRTWHGTWELANTDKGLMDKASQILAAAQVRHVYREAQRTSGNKPVYRVQVSRARDILMACKITIPYSAGDRLKRQQLLSSWAEQHLQFGHRRGRKGELAQKFATMMKGA